MKCQEVEAPRPPALKLSAPLAYMASLVSICDHIQVKTAVGFQLLYGRILRPNLPYANGADSFRAGGRGASTS